jgi:hypothetical protein
LGRGGAGDMIQQRSRQAFPVLPSVFKGFRFPPEIIVLAVRWYLRFGLSYRDVEELLTERGIEVDRVTVYRGCNASHRSSPMRPGRADTRSATVGTWTRPT